MIALEKADSSVRGRCALRFGIAQSLMLAIAVFSALAVSTSSFAQQRERASGPIPPEFFGMHIHNVVVRSDQGTVTRWPSVAFGSWRLMDAYVKWRDLEPAKGQWNFRTLDQSVLLAEQNGVDLVFTLGLTPRWASARPDEPTYTYGPGVAAEPRDIGDWENYVARVVGRYKGRIKYYEIWNEPWFSEIEKTIRSDGKAGFYSGSAAKMVEMAGVAYRVIKGIDPGAKVIAPSMDHANEGIKRLDLYLSLGGKAFTDIVGFHLYAPTPESTLPIIAGIRAVLARHGMSNTEIWNTESGYVIENPGEQTRSGGERVLSGQDAAGFVARSLLLAASSGISRFYWYAWDNRIRGLTSGRNKEINSAGVAFGIVRRWLVGAVIENCRSSANSQWVCELKRGQRIAKVAWNTGASSEWRIPDQWDVREYETLDGQVVRKGADGVVPLGGSPVLFKSDNLPWTPVR